MIRKYLLLLFVTATFAAAQQTYTQAEPARIGTNAVLTLDDVVAAVRSQNPAITSARHVVDARLRQVSQAGALPDPTLSASWMGSAVPFKTMADDPSSYRGLTAMQMLPLGGKRELQRDIARKDVLTAQADETGTIRRLVADAKAAFYDYFYYGKAIEITNRDKARLQELADISQARYRVGKAMQQDVLRAQVEISMLLQKAVSFEQQRQIAAARLNTLMGRPSSSPLPPAAEVQEQRLPAITSLTDAAENTDPELIRNQALVERNRLGIDLARKQYIPDLSVGYMFQQRTGMADMYGMQFTVNLPIFYKSKQRQAVEQAKQELYAANDSVNSRRLEIGYELNQMHALALNASKTMDLYRNAILPQANLALESSRSSYTVGTVDFLSVVTNFTTIDSYEIDYYRQLADYETALARIEALTGDLSAIGGEENKQ